MAVDDGSGQYKSKQEEQGKMKGEEIVGMANWGATPLGLVEASSLSIKGRFRGLMDRVVLYLELGVGLNLEWINGDLFEFLWYICTYVNCFINSFVQTIYEKELFYGKMKIILGKMPFKNCF